MTKTTNNPTSSREELARDLTVDQIDEAISTLILSGSHGNAAGVNLARIAGRVLKMLHTVVGPKAALIAAEALACVVAFHALKICAADAG